MELPSVGKQCSIPDCKQLDFLPLQCKCGRVFCSDHFTEHAGTCEKSRYLSEEELKSIRNVFVCSQAGCGQRSVVPLVCDRCKRHFCVQHRHLAECEVKDPGVLLAEKERYAAPVRQFNEAKAAVEKQVESSLAEAKKKEKNRATACKVQLMRIKNKATGPKTIPAADRVYFNVAHPKNREKTSAVFVSNQWSVGRAIDAIAEELKLQNNNNKMNEKKLRLFKQHDNEIICRNVSVTLNTLLSSNAIANGESLIIEYVDDECVNLV